MRTTRNATATWRERLRVPRSERISIEELYPGNRAVLVRSSDGNKQYNVRLRDLLKGGDVSANVDLLPGDVIMIPESWF